MFFVAAAFVVAFVAAGLLYVKHRLSNPPDRHDLSAAIDREVSKLTRHASKQGVVVGVYKNGKSFIRGYGTIDENGTAPSSTTVFQIASVSKLFTAATLQILCDKGVLSMDASLGELIGKKIALPPAVQRITLRQLATHTAGFPKDPESLIQLVAQRAGPDKLMLNPFSHIGPEDVFEYLKTAADKGESGRFEYSNFGMGLLGHVMEIVTQKNLETLVSETLLARLDMHDSAIDLTARMRAQLAPGRTADGEPNPLWTFGALAGAGAHSSTAEDLLRFVRANLTQDTKIAQSLERMQYPQPIGWMPPTLLDKFFGNRDVLWHNGMVGGYSSYMSIDTKAKTGVVVLSNQAIDITMLGMMLTRQARTQSWPAPQ